MAQRFGRIEAGHFTYLFREPTKKRDPSNIISAGVKLIEDALQEAGLLPNDGWRCVHGITCFWVHDPVKFGVTLFVREPMTFVETVMMDNESWRPHVKKRA